MKGQDHKKRSLKTLEDQIRAIEIGKAEVIEIDKIKIFDWSLEDQNSRAREVKAPAVTL